MMNDVDSAKSQKLENQVLELWDRIYQKWMSTSETVGPKVTATAVEHSWQSFVNDLQKSSGNFYLIVLRKISQFS